MKEWELNEFIKLHKPVWIVRNGKLKKLNLDDSWCVGISFQLEIDFYNFNTTLSHEAKRVLTQKQKNDGDVHIYLSIDIDEVYATKQDYLIIKEKKIGKVKNEQNKQ